jgi:hypothetical protein
MSRCISTAISLLWTEAQTVEKATKITEIIKKVLVNTKKILLKQDFYFR